MSALSTNLFDKRSPEPGVRPRNRLLAALPDDEFARVHACLNTITLRCKQTLYRQGERIRHLYFPNGGVCVVTAPTSNATMMQVIPVGDEGMIGIEAFLTDEPLASGDTFVQVASSDTAAHQIPVRDFRRISELRGALHHIIGRYAQAKFAVIVQHAACNASHTVEQRSARWLLNVLDRIHADEFDLTHDDFALLLAVHRPTLSECVHKLQARGLIRYRPGHMVVLDRSGLQDVACECYAITRALLDRVTHT